MNRSAQHAPGVHKCQVAGCDKAFGRKEHLTRHMKSHDPQRPYKCTSCGRGYARSDVLKRHREQHHPDESHNAHNASSVPPCTPCRERNSTCDSGVPCQSCLADSILCSRVPVAHSPSFQGILLEGNGSWNYGGEVQDDQMAVDDIAPQMSWNISQSPWGGHKQQPHQPQQQEQQRPPSLAWGSSPASFDQSVFPVPSVTPNAEEEIRLGTPHMVAANSTTGARRSSSAGSKQNAGASPSVGDSAASSHTSPPISSSKSPAATKWSQDNALADLTDYLDKEDLDLKRFIRVYLQDIHPSWSILHAPSFLIDDAPPLLLGAMAMLGIWLEGELDFIKLVPHVFDAVTTMLLETKSSFGRDRKPMSLHELQATLLCVVYCTLCLSSPGMATKALQINGLLVSTARQLGIFRGRCIQHHLGESKFASWLAQEQIHRLAFSILRMDAYLSVLLGHPPCVSHHELAIPLPKLAVLWNAANESERRRLQWSEPAGREKTLFPALMRDAMAARSIHANLTEPDYHLILCAMQSGIWNASQETYGEYDADDSSKFMPLGDSFHRCKQRLDLWQGCLEREHRVRQTYFSSAITSSPRTPDLLAANHSSTSPSSTDPLSHPLNILLWHFSYLTLNTSPQLLHTTTAICGSHAAGHTPPAQSGFPSGGDFHWMSTPSYLNAWTSTAQARAAVWHAAQIARVATHEASLPVPQSRDLRFPSLTNQVTESTGAGEASPGRPGSASARTPQQQQQNPRPRRQNPRPFLLNPLARPGLLKAAMVVCLFAHHAQVCGRGGECTNSGNGASTNGLRRDDASTNANASQNHSPNSNPDSNSSPGPGPSPTRLDLLRVAAGDSLLQRWIAGQDAGGDTPRTVQARSTEPAVVPVWDPAGVPLCRCYVRELAVWFQALVREERGAEVVFHEFIRGLLEGGRA